MVCIATSHNAGHTQKPKTTGNSYKEAQERIFMIPEIYEKCIDVQTDSFRTSASTYVKLMSLLSSLSFVRRILFTSSVDVVCLLYYRTYLYELITVSVVGDNKRFVFTRK